MGSVRFAINDEGAGAADAFAAVVIGSSPLSVNSSLTTSSISRNDILGFSVGVS